MLISIVVYMLFKTLCEHAAGKYHYIKSVLPARCIPVSTLAQTGSLQKCRNSPEPASIKFENKYDKILQPVARHDKLFTIAPERAHLNTERNYHNVWDRRPFCESPVCPDPSRSG